MLKRFMSTSLALVLGLTLFGCAKAPTWQEQYDLGVRYLSEGNYEEAIIAFTAAIEIDPKQATAYVGRGDAYVLSDETEDNLTVARLDYENAIELDDTCVEAYRGLADVYIWLGEYEKAREILRIGIEKNKNSEILVETLDELDGLSSNYSKYFTDDFISEEEFVIGNTPFYELSIESAIEQLPVSESPFRIEERLDESGNLFERVYTVYKYNCGIISVEQKASSKTLSGLRFSDYYNKKITIVETGIRDIKTGDSMEDVLEKIGVSSQGARILTETGMSVIIGADHTIEGGYGWIEAEDNMVSVNGVPAKTINLMMDTCSCQMDFIDNKLVSLHIFSH